MDTAPWVFAALLLPWLAQWPRSSYFITVCLNLVGFKITITVLMHPLHLWEFPEKCCFQGLFQWTSVTCFLKYEQVPHLSVKSRTLLSKNYLKVSWLSLFFCVDPWCSQQGPQLRIVRALSTMHLGGNFLFVTAKGLAGYMWNIGWAEHWEIKGISFILQNYSWAQPSLIIRFLRLPFCHATEVI